MFERMARLLIDVLSPRRPITSVPPEDKVLCLDVRVGGKPPRTPF